MANKIIGSTNTQGGCTSVTLTDLQLAKKDLQNHFSIKKGEKWNNPMFGTDIPNYLFQPLDELTTNLIRQEVIEVIDYDPRFALEDREITVQEDKHSVTVEVVVRYIPLSIVDTLAINFNKEDIETGNL